MQYGTTTPTTDATPTTTDVPSEATGAVLARSDEIPAGTPAVAGFEFDDGEPKVDLSALLTSYAYTGFQATNLALAIEEINKMIKWRLSDEPVKEDEDEDLRDEEARKQVKCTIFLGFTSNMISCGVREIMRFLVQHKMVDVIVTTAGGIEEDFLKCKNPHYMGDFDLDGRRLRMRGYNRIGNLIVPNGNYCSFEDWFTPLLGRMHDEQERDGVIWTPSSMIRRMGLEIADPTSVWYWAAKNDIPVFCPSLTDGSVGDMLFFHSYRRPGFVLDIARDIRGMNERALKAKKSGMIIIGGGLVKHHICNANLMRNGADFSVFLNTAVPFDGSDSGAAPSEAVSWGKIRLEARPVKIYAEATLVWPLLVAETFAKHGTRIPKHSEERLAFLAAKAAEAAEKEKGEGEEGEEGEEGVEGAAAGGGGGSGGVRDPRRVREFLAPLSRAERIRAAVAAIRAEKDSVTELA